MKNNGNNNGLNKEFKLAIGSWKNIWRDYDLHSRKRLMKCVIIDSLESAHENFPIVTSVTKLTPNSR